jgi:hypothetical protein
LKDYHSAYIKAGIPGHYDIGIARLCSGRPQMSDEGYDSLLQQVPSLDEMKLFFTVERDKFERSEAFKARREGHTSD